VIARSKELESSLGSIETAWRKVTGVAKAAWDAMLDIGRQKTPENELAQIERALEKASSTRRGGSALQGDQRRCGGLDWRGSLAPALDAEAPGTHRPQPRCHGKRQACDQHRGKGDGEASLPSD
jgi:hypothetical protein